MSEIIKTIKSVKDIDKEIYSLNYIEIIPLKCRPVCLFVTPKGIILPDNTKINLKLNEDCGTVLFCYENSETSEIFISDILVNKKEKIEEKHLLDRREKLCETKIYETIKKILEKEKKYKKVSYTFFMDENNFKKIDPRIIKKMGFPVLRNGLRIIKQGKEAKEGKENCKKILVLIKRTTNKEKPLSLMDLDSEEEFLPGCFTIHFPLKYQGKILNIKSIEESKRLDRFFESTDEMFIPVNYKNDNEIFI